MTQQRGLRQRAEQAAAGTDVERVVEGETLKQKIEQMGPEFARAMPRGAEAVQLVRDAQTALRNIPRLGECEPMTVLGALMNAAQLGLRVGVLGQSWVLPFYDTRNRGYKAQLVIGYQGYAELAYRSPRVSSVIARTVYEKDEYDVEQGTSDRIIHRPNLKVADRGPAVAYYAVVRTDNGGHVFWQMSRPEVEEHRDKFATTKTRDGKIFGPWVDHFDAMAQKTTFRMLAKYIPRATELATAIEVDGSVRFDATPTSPPDQVSAHVIAGEFTEGTTGEQPGEPDPTVQEGFGTPDGPR